MLKQCLYELAAVLLIVYFGTEPYPAKLSYEIQPTSKRWVYVGSRVIRPHTPAYVTVHNVPTSSGFA